MKFKICLYVYFLKENVFSLKKAWANDLLPDLKKMNIYDKALHLIIASERCYISQPDCDIQAGKKSAAKINR